MKHYVGLDVSMKETAICIVNEKQEIVYETMVPTRPERISQALVSQKVQIDRVGLESGPVSHLLTQELEAKKWPVICVDARHMAAILSVQINKTDRNDARGIAQAMRAGLYKPVYRKSPWSLEVGVLLACRQTQLRQRVQIANKIRGHLKLYNIRKIGRVGVAFSKKVGLLIEELPSGARLGLESLMRSYEALCQEVDLLTNKLREIAKAKPEAALLQTVPGIGLITSLTYLAEIDEPTRFSDPRAVGAWVGMTPTQYSSGDTCRQGRISKQGNRDLRCLLYEAGLVILTRTKSWSKLKAWGTRIKKRNGTKKAAVAVGRKLAIIMHQMLLTGEPFQYGEPKKVV